MAYNPRPEKGDMAVVHFTSGETLKGTLVETTKNPKLMWCIQDISNDNCYFWFKDFECIGVVKEDDNESEERECQMSKL